MIEAAFENEQVKAQVLRRLDAILPTACLIASNTTISITALSAHVEQAGCNEKAGRSWYRYPG